MSVSYNYPVPATLKGLCTRLHTFADRTSRFSFVDVDGSEVFRKAYTNQSRALEQSPCDAPSIWDFLPSNKVFRVLRLLVGAECLELISWSNNSMCFRIRSAPNMLHILESPRVKSMLEQEERAARKSAASAILDEEDDVEDGRCGEESTKHPIPPAAEVVEEPQKGRSKQEALGRIPSPVAAVVESECPVRIEASHIKDMYRRHCFDLLSTKATLVLPVGIGHRHAAEFQLREQSAFKPGGWIDILCEFISCAMATEGCEIGWAGSTLVVRHTTDIPAAHREVLARTWLFKYELRERTTQYAKYIQEVAEANGLTTEEGANVRLEMLDCGPNKFAEPEVTVDIQFTTAPTILSVE